MLCDVDECYTVKFLWADKCSYPLFKHSVMKAYRGVEIMLDAQAVVPPGNKLPLPSRLRRLGGPRSHYAVVAVGTTWNAVSVNQISRRLVPSQCCCCYCCYINAD